MLFPHRVRFHPTPDSYTYLLRLSLKSRFGITGEATSGKGYPSHSDGALYVDAVKTKKKSSGTEVFDDAINSIRVGTLFL